MKTYRSKNQITEIVSNLSKYMTDYLNASNESDYLLISKQIYHSDLPTYGKANKSHKLSKNLLYYLSTEEMIRIEEERNSLFEVAKQSNINLPLEFFDFLELARPRDLEKEKSISDYYDVYLVNDSLKDFNYESTMIIHSRLKHELSKNYSNQLKKITFLSDNDLTKIDLSYAKHGIGVASNMDFHSLRSTIFRQDNIYLLIESFKGIKKIFILLKRSPVFYKIIYHQSNEWLDYVVREETRKEFEYNLLSQREDTEKSRVQQSAWRNLLAEEMLNYNTKDNYLFCPFTYLELDFNKAGTLMRASHIKPYNECNDEEAFDINNGLLLSANADALFDKYLISVNEKKELEYSFLISNEHTLIIELNLNKKIFDLILNQKRMVYLREHYSKFLLYEDNRKKGL
jgi:predicted nucleic acid-binding protein